MKKPLNDAQVNHLRKLLGWVRCEIGPTPEELKAIVGDIAPGFDEISDDAKQRLVEAHEKAAAVPAYVRQAVKMLERYIEQGGDVVDVEAEEIMSVEHRATIGITEQK